MKLVIDRFEGKYAVCEKENGEMINIEKNSIPSNAKEGDVLIVSPNKVEIDSKSTKERKAQIDDLTKDIWSL